MVGATMKEGTKRVAFTADDFTADPALFERVQKAWERKWWLNILGEMPEDGRVLARVLPPEEGGGIAFYYRPAR